MATGPRVTILPIPMNATPNTPALFPSAPAAGYDTGSPGGTFTAWSTTLGVMIPQPNVQSTVWLWFLCGATPAGAYQVLVGDLVGQTGQVLPATAYAGTIAATTSGWLGPWSPSSFNQQAPTQVTYSGAINTTALVAAAQGCVVVDFTTTTTLSVRAYQVIPVN
jgi:hypothetical protein